MTAAVTGTTGTASSSSTSTTKTAAQEQEDRFLKLLVTQMQNQDPLNPLDNAQVTSQMAQLSTVTGIEKLNATLTAMNEAQSFQSASLIGHSVLAPGSLLTLTSAGGVGGADLSTAADTVTVSIMDSKNNVVRTLELGKKDSGTFAFTWDGKKTDGTQADVGNYSFKVKATLDGESVTSTSLAVGQVNSVLMSSTGSTLNVTGLGEVSLSDVRQVM
jgi:flagellar basal-body rod modification protein FlgD